LALDRAPKTDHALYLLKAERGVGGVAGQVLGVGAHVAAAMTSARPTPRFGLDIPVFDEGDG
jgi:hypothetical protein